MSKGKAKVTYLDKQGMVAHANAPSWDFLYETSTIRNPNYNIGDKVVLPDGREFIYAKSASALYAGQGCEFTATGYTAYTAFGVSASIGDKELTVPAATHAALTEDELRGGYIVIFDGASNHYTTIRGIIGNDAAASGAAFKVYLDAAITYAVTAGTSACETYQNPYASLTLGSDAAKSKAGVPTTYVSAASKYFWVQKKGMIWLPPQTSNVGENGGRGCFWRHDGTLEGAEVALGGLTVPAGDTSQYAGYCVEGSQAGNGPLFMLQG